jgi:hypothetical protein
MAGYVAHKGMEEFGGEASRQEKAYHVAFGTVPVAFWHSACVLITRIKHEPQVPEILFETFLVRLMLKGA